jgi:DNA relaxase NicK
MSCGIDYLSLTRALDDDTSLWRVATKIMGDNKTKEMRLYGFSGKYYNDGVCGHLFYGENHKSVPNREFVQLGGQLADMWWTSFLNEGLPRANVTRIDLRVDAELYDPSPNLAKVYYDEIKSESLIRPLKVKTYSYVESNTGSTFYLGSRTSKIYGRVYDKSGHLTRGKDRGRVWRYEIEAKSSAAKDISVALLDTYNTRPNVDGLAQIGRFVFDWFNQRNVPPVFDLSAHNVERIELSSTTRYGDKMLWLRQQVSPSVRRLIAHGRGQEVIEALGLSSYIDSLKCGR